MQQRCHCPWVRDAVSQQFPACADPHPGNIAVDATGGGRLIYYGECVERLPAAGVLVRHFFSFTMCSKLSTDLSCVCLQISVSIRERWDETALSHLSSCGLHVACFRALGTAVRREFRAALCARVRRRVRRRHDGRDPQGRAVRPAGAVLRCLLPRPLVALARACTAKRSGCMRLCSAAGFLDL